MNIFTLVGKITLEGMDAANKQLNGLNGVVQKNQQALRTAGVALTAVGAAITGTIGYMTKLAVDTVESENLFVVSMGKMQGAAEEWSKTLSKSLGLNEFELRKNIGVLYTMTTSMGLTENEAYNLSKGMTELAYDMASFYNLNPEEAFAKLRSGISGETEPLKRLGILVDENTTKQYAYSEGIADSGTQLTNQQKVQARYIAILKQTSNAQGDLARTLDSPANKLRILQTHIQETATKIGTNFLPILSSVVGTLSDIATKIGAWVEKHPQLTQIIAISVGVIGLLSAGLGVLLILLPSLTVAVATFGVAWSIALAGIPLLIGAIVAGTVALVKNWDKVVQFFKDAWENIKMFFLRGILSVLDSISKFTKFIPGLNKLVDSAREKISGMIDEAEIKKNIEGTIKDLEEWADKQKEILNQNLEDKKKALDRARGYAQETYDQEVSDLRDKYGVLEDYDEDYTETLMDAARRRREEREDEIDREMDAERKAFDERIQMINDEYDARLKLIDDAAAQQIKELQDQIEAIQDAQDAEDKARRDEEDAIKEAELRKRLMTAETFEDYEKARADLDKFLADKAAREAREARQAQVDALRDQIDDVRANARDQKDSIEEERDAKIKAEDEKLEKVLDTLQTEKDALDQHLEEELVRLEKERQAAEEAAQAILDDRIEKLTDQEEALAASHIAQIEEIDAFVSGANEAYGNLKTRYDVSVITHFEEENTSQRSAPIPEGLPPELASHALMGYAAGGPILGPTLLTRLSDMKPYAVAGEYGPENVIPAGGGYRSANITIEMDGATIARLIGQPLVDQIRLKTGVKI